ncbi:LacI family transcriptional regulator, partial [Streptomyces sp. SID5914]|nr:LacI family transcriptional regulator [Streptomyces sp. SID5914]
MSSETPAADRTSGSGRTADDGAARQPGMVDVARLAGVSAQTV